MKPKELSAEIRRIASAIENSKNPSRELVARDIKGLLYAIAGKNEKTDTRAKLRLKLKNKGIPENYLNEAMEAFSEVLGGSAGEKNRLHDDLERKNKPSSAKSDKE